MKFTIKRALSDSQRKVVEEKLNENFSFESIVAIMQAKIQKTNKKEVKIYQINDNGIVAYTFSDVAPSLVLPACINLADYRSYLKKKNKVGNEFRNLAYGTSGIPYISKASNTSLLSTKYDIIDLNRDNITVSIQFEDVGFNSFLDFIASRAGLQGISKILGPLGNYDVISDKTYTELQSLYQLKSGELIYV